MAFVARRGSLGVLTTALEHHARRGLSSNTFKYTKVDPVQREFLKSLASLKEAVQAGKSQGKLSAAEKSALNEELDAVRRRDGLEDIKVEQTEDVAFGSYTKKAFGLK